MMFFLGACFIVLVWLACGFITLCWGAGTGLLEDDDLLLSDEPSWWAGLLNFALWPYVMWRANRR